jgi:hypothetical protein
MQVRAQTEVDMPESTAAAPTLLDNNDDAAGAISSQPLPRAADP